MEKKFNVGDRVRMKRTVCFDYITFEKGCVGEVVSDETDKGTCFVRMKNAENGTIINHFICTSNLDLIDTKTAFLAELRGMLEKYGVSIMLDAEGSYCGNDVKSVTMSFCFNHEYINYTITDFGKEITADNIMDYDKE